PVAAGRIGIEVAADEAKLVHAALELDDRMLDGHARRLRQLAYADEVLGIEIDDTLDQVVARTRPRLRSRLVADVVRHRRGARREDRDVRTALALDLELVLLDRLADLVIADARWRRRRERRILQARELLIAELLVRRRRRGVVPVTI